MKTYLVSGLGADKRIFSKLKLDSSFDIIHIDWIEPFKNESLSSYAKRLSTVIDTNSPFVLIGVSFGGIIAVEIAKLLNPFFTVIISSIISNNQLPLSYQIAGKLKLIKLIPSWLLKSSNRLTQNYFFGTNSMEEKRLLRKIIVDTDPKFLKWAIEAILNWKNKVRPPRIYHIHGKSDKILYFKNTTPDFVIDQGTHFMVYQNAAQIIEIINIVKTEATAMFNLESSLQSKI